MSTIEEKNNNVLNVAAIHYQTDKRIDLLLRCADTLSRYDAWRARYEARLENERDKSK